MCSIAKIEGKQHKYHIIILNGINVQHFYILNKFQADEVTFPPQVSVMSYSAKFASCYYGPFRYLTCSTFHILVPFLFFCWFISKSNNTLTGMPLSPSQLSETDDATSCPLVPEDLLCEPVYDKRIKIKRLCKKTHMNLTDITNTGLFIIL